VITGAAPRAFHVMSKPTGAICNLDCEYCFFLSKEELYPGSGFRMDRGHNCNHGGTIDLEASVVHEPAWGFTAGRESSITAGHKAKARSEDRAFTHVRRVGLEPTTRGLRDAPEPFQGMLDFPE